MQIVPIEASAVLSSNLVKGATLKEPFPDQPVHSLHSRIVPATQGLPPTYGQLAFDTKRAARSFVLLASRDGRKESIQVDQDVDVWKTRLHEGGRARSFSLPTSRRLFRRLREEILVSLLETGDGLDDSLERRLLRR